MLRIEVAENGFVVFENRYPGEMGKQYAFESAETLSSFIKEWGQENEKTSTEDNQARS